MKSKKIIVLKENCENTIKKCKILSSYSTNYSYIIYVCSCPSCFYE